jgi:hypothetical protein
MNEIQKTESNIPTVLDEELLRMRGLGGENVKAKDVLIPRLTILQALSPQVNKKKAEYIENAEVGDFCNVATGDIYKEEIEVIPVHFATNYIEWTKNRGGLANNYGDHPEILEKTTRTDKGENIMPNGNIVQETAQWYCLLRDGADWTRVFLPLKATTLKVSRKWMTLVRAEVVELPTGPWKPPLFWRSWKLKIIGESNDQGDWFTFKPIKGDLVMDIDPSKQLIRSAMAFYEDVKSEKVRGEVAEDEGKTINSKVNDPTKADIPF